MHSKHNAIEHNLAKISAYEMNQTAQNLLQEKADEWGLSPEQVQQLSSAAPEELELLGQTIRKVWKWEQFSVQTERIEELVSRKQLLIKGLRRLEAEDAEQSDKEQELKIISKQLQQLLIVERDQEDAVDTVVSEVHKWTHTAAKKNALHKLLAASPVYTQNKQAETLSDEVLSAIQQDLQDYTQSHGIVISDNGQTFDAKELLALLL